MNDVNKRIYLDYAATTPLDPAVFEAMLPYLWRESGNPSSVHASGREAQSALDQSRQQVSEAIGAQPHEIVFTSGGTESNNLGVMGAAKAASDRGRHIVTTSIEHHAVLHAVRALASEGFHVTELPVDSCGRVRPDDLERAIRPDTVLVSIGLANNEIGTVQQLETLTGIAHSAGALVHTDAVQAVGQVDINVDRLGVDLLSMTAHKIYGPKSVGGLYVREGVDVRPHVFGGAQERNLRAGTPDVPGIVGFGVAITRAQESRSTRVSHYRELVTVLVQQVVDGCPAARMTGDPCNRLASFASFAFHQIDAESLLQRLDLDGIEVSTGSACASGSLEVSHVMQALQFPASYRRGALRCTVGMPTNRRDVEMAADSIVRQVRALEMVEDKFVGEA